MNREPPPSPDDREAFKAWAARMREAYEDDRRRTSNEVLTFYKHQYGGGIVR